MKNAKALVRQAINSNLNFQQRKKIAQKKERIMTTNQLKSLYNKEAIKYYKSVNRVFTIDQNNKNYLNLLCKYFANDQTFETFHEGELRKGLFFYGNTGTGKTTSLQIIQNISKKYNIKPLWFPIIEAGKVVEQFNTEKNKDYVVIKYSSGKILFDDLGAENEANNIFIYGKEDIFVRILENRYNDYVTKGIKTHITSNLTIEDIKDRYGSRVEDRLVQMCNFIEAPGDTRRK